MKAVMVRQEAVKMQAVLNFSYTQLLNNLHFGTLNTDPSKLPFEHQMPASYTAYIAVFVPLFEDFIVSCPYWLNKKWEIKRTKIISSEGLLSTCYTWENRRLYEACCRVTWISEVIGLKPINHVFSCEDEQQNKRTCVENVSSKLWMKDKASLGSYTFLLVNEKWSLLLLGTW